MNIMLDSVPSRLADAGYLPRFQLVFGQQMSAIDIGQVAHALNAHLHTPTPTPTCFDEFLRGDITALNDTELLGLHLFRSKGRCMNCHFGQAMSDGDFHNLNQTLAGRPAKTLANTTSQATLPILVNLKHRLCETLAHQNRGFIMVCLPICLAWWRFTTQVWTYRLPAPPHPLPMLTT